MQIREAGAVARAMLVAAAAASWGVPAARSSSPQGVHVAQVRQQGPVRRVRRRRGQARRARNVAAEGAADFTLIGKDARDRLDTEAKITGQPIYTQDIHLDGMIVAAVVHPPRFGGEVDEIDASKAAKVDGFLDAQDHPAGRRGLRQEHLAGVQGPRARVEVTWDDCKAEKRGSAELLEEYKRARRDAGRRRRQTSATPTRRWRRPPR